MSQVNGGGGGSSGAITAVDGTANQIDVSTTGSTATVSLDSAIITPGSLQVTGQILAEDGTSTLPAISFGNSPNNGFIRGGADEIDLVWNGSESIQFFSGQTRFNNNISTSSGADLVLGGAIYLNVTTPGSYPYTTSPHDSLILVDTSSARTINLAASPGTGLFLTIKDNVGSGVTNHITVSGNGNNIDGAGSATILTAYGFLQLVFNGTQWNVVSKG